MYLHILLVYLVNSHQREPPWKAAFIDRLSPETKKLYAVSYTSCLQNASRALLGEGIQIAYFKAQIFHLYVQLNSETVVTLFYCWILLVVPPATL